MKTTQLLVQIGELILISEDSTKDWIEVPVLRRDWLLCCFSLLAAFVVFSLRLPLQSVLESSPSLTLMYRACCFAIVLWLEMCEILLAFHYYRFSISRKVEIRFDNILTFYFTSIVLFSLLYFLLYSLSQQSFVYFNPPLALSSTTKSIDFWGSERMKLDFLLFSAFNSVNGSFYKIQPHSIWVSVLSYVQSLFTLILASLFVASYVNRHSN
jgi:hypothetical protein